VGDNRSLPRPSAAFRSGGHGGGGCVNTSTVVNTYQALAHRPAVIGEIRAGPFPHDLNVDPGAG